MSCRWRRITIRHLAKLSRYVKSIAKSPQDQGGVQRNPCRLASSRGFPRADEAAEALRAHAYSA